jgi:hypothetical protein
MAKCMVGLVPQDAQGGFIKGGNFRVFLSDPPDQDERLIDPSSCSVQPGLWAISQG